MAAAIAHRGPDDQGTYVDDSAGVALAHRRLSIIDLSSGGHQPMIADDNSVVLVFNGELYNYLALKQELEALGRQFRSRSDTEVVLNALAQWGPAALGRFNGMFALAAWYPREGKLLLARDPMGMKPLYYTPLAGGGVVFASEVKAFLALRGFKPEINPRSLQQYLEFGYVFDEQDTSLAGVSKLPPGHAMEIIAGRAGPPYAYFPAPVSRERDERTARRRWSTSCTPRSRKSCGSIWSPTCRWVCCSPGGLDSSIIAALAARDTRVATISMGFAESAIDERPFARTVAEHIGSDHHEVLIHHREMVEDLAEVVWYFDDLFADWGTVSTRLLYRKCREQGIKVVLVGEGSDELFGGYPIFAAAQRVRGPDALAAVPALPPLRRAPLWRAVPGVRLDHAQLSGAERRQHVRCRASLRIAQPVAQQLRDEGGQGQHVGQRGGARAVPRPPCGRTCLCRCRTGICWRRAPTSSCCGAWRSGIGFCRRRLPAGPSSARPSPRRGWTSPPSSGATRAKSSSIGTAGSTGWGSAAR